MSSAGSLPPAPPPPTILVTGAGGFIGQLLAAELLATHADARLLLTDTFEPPVPPSVPQQSRSRVECVAADLTDPASSHPALGLVAAAAAATAAGDDEQERGRRNLVAAFTLHGIMSAGSEADLELGLKVNLDSHRALLDALRTHFPGITVVFPSSIAIFQANPPTGSGGGGDGGAAFTELTLPLPQGSYGAQKLMVELLVNDYSRRGLIDGRVCRLPTVMVRPGKPSAAASSFVSGIVRESLAGVANVLPVREEVELWVCSPGAAVRNLARMMRVPKEKFASQGARRVNLPGQTVTVRQILEALEEVGGKQARALVRPERDAAVEALVENWPTRFDTSFATEELGLEPDVDLRENIKAFRDGAR